MALPAFAGPSAKEQLSKSVVEPEPPSRIHALINVDVSDHYITPRGLNVENSGVIFQPLVLIFWNLYSSDSGFLNDVTLTTGVWNSIHTKESGLVPGRTTSKNGHWNEIDPIGGLTFKFLKGFQFDAFWSAFKSQTDSYETSNNLSLKLTYHDSFCESFSINPYVEYWQELSDKATVTFNPATSDESYYFSIGIDPTYKFKSIPLTVELPTFINLVEKDFYQKFDGTGGGSGLAVFSTQFKVSTPLSFIPKGYGSWTFYASAQYYHLSNDGLRDGNIALGSGDRDNLLQFHSGISVFF
jgi:hypothetical protein